MLVVIITLLPEIAEPDLELLYHLAVPVREMGVHLIHQHCLILAVES